MELPRNRTILLHVQYDGTDFCGWQFQPGLRSVQGELMTSLESMVHHPVELWASSRTDAGVHARSMPVAFDTSTAIVPHGFFRGLSAKLPPDMSVLSSEERPFGFRPRDASVAKTYVYRFQLGAQRALSARYTWWLKRPSLDIDAMREAATHFLGERNYAAFRSVHCDSRSTDRFMHHVDISEPDADQIVSVTITGNAFLRNMVRIMAGALCVVGYHRRPPSWIGDALESGIRDDAAQTAPARGLTLAKVHFSGYPRIAKAPLPDGVEDRDPTADVVSAQETS